MTIHRFYISEINPIDNEIIFPPDITHQIIKVLHLKPGDDVIIFNGSGTEYAVRIMNNELGIMGKVVQQRENNNEPVINVTLYQALIRREKFEDILEKATEIGVATFVPVEMQRSIVRAKDIDEKKVTRWQKIIQEAAEQSERGRVPEILPTMNFEQALQKASKEGPVFIALERQNNSRSSNLSHVTGAVSLFIGPEGGFTDEEKELIKKYNAILLSLGPRILRSETAALVASSLILLSADFQYVISY